MTNDKTETDEDIWQAFDRVLKDNPIEGLPQDLAENHDKYLYEKTMTDEKQTDCDGWAAYARGEFISITFALSERAVWGHVINGYPGAMPDNADYERLKAKWTADGYTVRPVCFVSPSDKELLDIVKTAADNLQHEPPKPR